ncbi:MAG: hypothetical protein L7W43_00255 [Rubripirellula sp.]|nr:hypothetical protein [Rubripirellula sp.]
MGRLKRYGKAEPSETEGYHIATASGGTGIYHFIYKVAYVATSHPPLTRKHSRTQGT